MYFPTESDLEPAHRVAPGDLISSAEAFFSLAYLAALPTVGKESLKCENNESNNSN